MLWLGLTAGFYAFIARGDDVVRPRFRRRVSVLLLRARPSKLVSGFLDGFLALFDAIFGERHFSWRCFLRSAILSVVLVLLLGSWQMARTGLAVPWVQELPKFFVVALVANLLPDYFSLLETRLVLKKMSQTSSATVVVGYMLLDIVLTSIAAAVAVVVACSINDDYYFYTPEVYLSPEGSWQDPNPFIAPLTFQNLSSVFAYSTYFTSIWVWLYLLSAVLVRIASNADPLSRRVVRVLDFRSKPFRSLGFVCTVVLTGMFLLAMPFYLWLK